MPFVEEAPTVTGGHFIDDAPMGGHFVEEPEPSNQNPSTSFTELPNRPKPALMGRMNSQAEIPSDETKDLSKPTPEAEAAWEAIKGAVSKTANISRAIPADVAETISGNQKYYELNNLAAATIGEQMPIDERLKEAADSGATGAATVGKISQGLAGTAPLLVTGALPAWVQKIVALGFSADMIANSGEAAASLGEEMGKPPENRDRDKLSTALSDIIQIGAFAPLAAKHGARDFIESKVTPDIHVIRQLSEQLKNEPLAMPIPSRNAELIKVADEIAPIAPLTAEALKIKSVETPKVETPVENAPETANSGTPVVAPEKPLDVPKVELEKVDETPLVKEAETTIPEESISRGPGAAAAGEPGTYSAIQQLADTLRATTPKEAPIEAKIDLMDRAKATVAGAKESLKEVAAKAVAVKDAIWDAYSKPAEFGDIKKSVGRWTYALQKSDYEARQFSKAIIKEVPDKLRREAITNWIQADGDVAKLQERADLSKPQFKAGYQAALNLSPREIEIAQMLRDYFDRQLEQGIGAGILKNGIDNYVSQVWKKENPITRRVVNDLTTEKLQPKFRFARQRIFESYFEGEQAGYKPSTKDVGALVSFYDQSFNKAIAARAFIKELHEGKASDGRPLVEVSGAGKLIEKDEGNSVLITPRAKPEEIGDYRQIDHPALRGWKYLTTTPEGAPVLLEGQLEVHPEIYQKLRNRLSASSFRQNPVGRAILGLQSEFKQTMLSISGFHQAQETLHALGHRVSPANLSEIDFTEPLTKALVEHGLQLADYHAMEAFAEGLSGGGGLTGKIPILGSKVLKPYTEWLFQEYIPRIKLTMAKHALERNIERYKGKLSDDQILELTSNQANAAFGELNYRYMGRNPTVQDALRVFLLAPDFLEARASFVGQALKPKGAEQLQALGLLAATLYMTARITNQLLNDDPHWESKNAFSIVYKDHSYTLRSVPGDLIHLFSDPRSFSYHRLSPIVGRGLVEGITGRDSRGVKKDALEQLQDTAENIIPISLKNSKDQKLWESFLNAIGITTRRYDAVQQINDKAKAFAEKTGKRSAFEFVYDPKSDIHLKLRNAIANRDVDGAKKEYQKLLEKESAESISKSMERYYTKPITGSLAKEEKFLETLNEADKKEYQKAMELREARLNLFREITQ